jgi:outer membrane protein OmpA-like peptidoglycan-associated protein
VKGTIVSRNGELVTVKDKKSGSTTVVDITGNTKIERKHCKVEFFRHSDMDVTAMVQGLTSDLDSYKIVAEAVIYFPADGSVLDDAAEADLATLASYTNGGLDGYMVEIAGYASSIGAKQHNQKLSEDRAANVAKYLQDTQNVPLRRILVPAGYGATHPDATNSDSQGRALNRRVDMKVLVNKGLSEGT